jgi:hypothetical protein
VQDGAQAHIETVKALRRLQTNINCLPRMPRSFYDALWKNILVVILKNGPCQQDFLT